MSEIDPGTDTPLLNGSELGVTEVLPTGTVTLLLADVEGSTRLWQTRPEETTAAFARLDAALAELVAAHGGAGVVGPARGPGTTRRRGRRHTLALMYEDHHHQCK